MFVDVWYNLFYKIQLKRNIVLILRKFVRFKIINTGGEEKWVGRIVNSNSNYYVNTWREI